MGLDPQETRYWLLFWDQLVLPEVCGIYLESEGDESFLESVGVLKRFIVDGNLCMHDDPTKDRDDEQYQHHFMNAFRQLEVAQPGCWSIATGPRSITLDQEHLDAGRGVLVELHRALPVPGGDTPLDDLLKFKERRRDELLEVRHRL